MQLPNLTNLRITKTTINLFKIFKILVGALLITILVVIGQDYLQTRKLTYKIDQTQQTFTTKFEDELFSEHLKLIDAFTQQQEIQRLQTSLTDLQTKLESEEYSQVPEVYTNYQAFITKLARNQTESLDTTETEEAATAWADMLLEQKFTELATLITEESKRLDDAHDEYIASLPPPPAPVYSGGGGEYNYQTVNTEKGTFSAYVLKVPLSNVKIVTAAANGDDCKDNCPTKSLAQHVNDNGGFAGMNGTYFCPPDYGECNGKINSVDFAFYKSSSGKWLNKKALGWADTGLMTFRNGQAKFYKKSTDYGGNSVEAGLSNYPPLVKDRNIVYNEDKLTSYQKNVRGTRGVIGVGDTNIYLTHVMGATVPEAAYVARALGMKHALNLDGGGSTAMYYNGGYILGPGRSLPNAVVLVRR